MDLSAPTISVTQQSGTGSGVTFNYTITAGGSDIVSVQLPDGFALDESVTLPTTAPITGSLTFTQSGSYVIIVTDAAGHVVQSDPMTVDIRQDLVAPTVRLSAATNGEETLTVNVSVFEEGGSTPIVAVAGGGNPSVSLTDDGDGAYTGSFTATADGTYTVTATDAAGYAGTDSITVHSVEFSSESISGPTQLVASGDYAIQPTAPTRAGYTFAGWYRNDTAYDFRTAVTENITLTARWTALPADKPTVTAGQGVTQSYGIQTGAVSVTVTQENGYTYAYQWYSNGTNSSSGGMAIAGATASSYTIPTDTAVGTHYYYCVVTATRDDNGETAAETCDAITVTVTKAGQTAPADGQGYTIHYKDETIIIQDGYEVYTAQDSGAQVDSGDTITPDATLYIRRPGSETHAPSDWTKIDVPSRPAVPDGITHTDETIKGKSDGTVSGLLPSMQYRIGDGQWETGTGENLTGLSAGTTVTVRYPASDVDFASEQTQVTIAAGTQTLTVIFDENGGTTVADINNFAYGDKITEPDISRTGYTLDGWYNGETKWNFAADTVTDDITLTAKWTPVTYTITYELAGGSLAEGQRNPASYTVETQDVTLLNPTKSGYTFAGWTESGGTEPVQNVTIPQGRPATRSTPHTGR